jgi:hypothetical protein
MKPMKINPNLELSERVVNFGADACYLYLSYRRL